ncbi:MAG: hypothetical protein ACE5JP_10775 [Candidatus Bipolaricaulia bacterium]
MSRSVSVAVLLVFLILVSFSVTVKAPQQCSPGGGNQRVCITVHANLNLGLIDETIYSGATPGGGGSFGDLESLSNTVNVKSNPTWSLEIEATATSAPAGFTGNLLADFQWRGGDQVAYTSFPALNTMMTVVASDTGNNVNVGMDYRYSVDIDDIPGSYSITLQYTASNQLGYTISDTVTLSWDTYTWAQIAIHGAISLGIIDETIYSGATPGGGGSFQALESTANNVFIITNDPDGWTLQIEMTAKTEPVGFTGDLLADFQWRGGDQAIYTSFAALSTPMTVATTTSQGSQVYNIDYRYTGDTDDIPGNYSDTLQFTVTTG